MNEVETIDWNRWEVDEPPSRFADRVMEVVTSGGLDELPVSPVRRTSSAPKVALLVAAALAVASAAALAAVGYRSMSRSREAPREEPGRAPAGPAPLATDAAATATATVERAP